MWLAGILTGLLLAGCGSAAPTAATSPAKAAPPATTASVTRLDVGLPFVDIGAIPLWVGVAKGIFRRYGVDVHFVQMRGGTEAVAAMSSGRMPVAMIGGPPVVAPVVKGVPLQLVAGLVDLMPYDFVVAPNITSAAQLQGAKGGVSGINSTDYYVQRYALSRLHVDPNRVVWLQVGNETERLAAIQSGQIQFTALAAGIDAAAFQGGVHSLLKMYQTGQPFQQIAVVVYKPWAKGHSALLEDLLKGLVASMVYVKNPANEGSVLAVTKTQLHLPARILKNAFELYRDRIFHRYPLVSRAGMRFVLGIEKVKRPAHDFYSNRYLRVLEQQHFAKSVGG